MKKYIGLFLGSLVLVFPKCSIAQFESVQLELKGVSGAKVSESDGGINVFLEGTSIDPLRIKKLARFEGLQYLSLKGNRASDSILEGVAKFPDLKWIKVYDGDVSDAGLNYLSKSKSLEKIELFSARITDEGVKSLAKLTRLKFFCVWGAKQVTDQSVAELTSKCAFLEDLDLSYTGITDQALKEMEKLPSLKRLVVDNTKVTKAQVEKLKKVFPKAIIFYFVP